MKYERIREIFNLCGNSSMRDVSIEEIESDDIDLDILQFCNGNNVHCDKIEKKDGTVFALSTDGLNQRITYTEIE